MPISSMIDIVFLLLIYFVVTQKPIIEDTLFGVNFPSQDSKSSKAKPPSTILCIEIKNVSETSDDDFLLNGQKYSFEKLKQTLQDTVLRDADTLVIIKCDPQSKHSNLIRFLDFCHNAKIAKISLAG